LSFDIHLIPAVCLVTCPLFFHPFIPVVRVNLGKTASQEKRPLKQSVYRKTSNKHGPQNPGI